MTAGKIARIAAAGAVAAVVVYVLIKTPTSDDDTDDYRAVAHLYGTSGCTGTIIEAATQAAPGKLITAAHCIPDDRKVEMRNEAIAFRIASCRKHVSYQKVPLFDVAICRFPYRPNDPDPEHLAAPNTNVHDQDVTYVGYGSESLLRLLGYDPPRRKRQGRTTRQGGLLAIDGDDTERGDSGGPVFLGDTLPAGPLIGIVSCFDDETCPDGYHETLGVNLVDPEVRKWVDACMADESKCL